MIAFDKMSNSEVRVHLKELMNRRVLSDEWTDLIARADELLGEEEDKYVIPDYSKMFKHYVCPKCSLVLEEGRDNFCPSCGVGIKWDEAEDDEE